MGDKPVSWYKYKGDAEGYARFYSGRKATYKAVPSGQGWTIQKQPKRKRRWTRKPGSPLQRRAKRGRQQLTSAIKRRVRKAAGTRRRRRRR